MPSEIKLKIADIIMGMKSKFPMKPVEQLEESSHYNNFVYKGAGNSDIFLEIKLARNLPALGKDTKRIFLSQRPGEDGRNWELFKNKDYYVLRQHFREVRQFYRISHDFTRAKVYLSKTKKDAFEWDIAEIIYDALHLILMHYLSTRGGVFIHAFGVRDVNGGGLLFAGNSGKGKSTLAKLWYRYSRSVVLNDDRVIVRKVGDRFFIYGSPWHGEFSDYLASKIERASLENIFFIYHSKKNQAVILKKGAFEMIYPLVFPVFWEKGNLENNIYFCQELIRKVFCFRLGFKNTKEVIGFVSRIKY